MVVRVLYLVGSRRSKFYYDLSVLYGKACDGCVDLDRERFEFHIAVVHLDGSWSFPSSLDEACSPHVLCGGYDSLQVFGGFA